MARSRRKFLARTAAGSWAQRPRRGARGVGGPDPAPTPVAGTPPAFGTAPPVGPEVTPATFAEAEKLVRVEMTAADRAQAAGNWRQRDGPDAWSGARARARSRSSDSVAPATRWDPMIPGVPAVPGARPLRAQRRGAAAPLPKSDDDIAFAPVARAVALDRVARADLRAADADLPRADRALRPEAQVRHHADARPRARAGQARGRGDRGGQLPRPAPRHPVGRQGPPRHQGHPDDLGRRAVPQPRARRRRRGRRAAPRTPARSSWPSSRSARWR